LNPGKQRKNSAERYPSIPVGRSKTPSVSLGRKLRLEVGASFTPPNGRCPMPSQSFSLFTHHSIGTPHSAIRIYVIRLKNPTEISRVFDFKAAQF
jgi:hypothetical protein